MSVHTVFSAECNHALTWQAVALFHSHATCGQPGPITRLLACNPDQLASYAGMDAGPTFVHHNMRFGHPTLIDELGYPSYNKPASVIFWLAETNPPEDFVALLDVEYAYLIGTEGPFARRFLEPHELSMQARVGGFHVFHKEDLRRIAPLWLEFTRSVRAFAHEEPEAYFSESFLQARLLAAHLRTYSWVCTAKGVCQLISASSATDGYVFAAARANVSHIVRRDTMLYPGYEPPAGDSHSPASRRPLSALLFPRRTHPINLALRAVYFNKMEYTDLDVYHFIRSTTCRADTLPAEQQSGPAPFFFSEPPPLLYTKGGRTVFAL
ncbi:MAG: hypothetical protein SGPRY_010867 [Prymnesium sp.]